MSADKRNILGVDLQKWEEHDRFYAQEFGQRLHRFQLIVVGSVEKHQAVHGHELTAVVYECDVGIGDRGFKLTLPVNAIQLANNRNDRRQRSNYGVLQDSVLAVVHHLPSHAPRSHPAEREEVTNLRLELTGNNEVHLQI